MTEIEVVVSFDPLMLVGDEEKGKLYSSNEVDVTVEGLVDEVGLRGRDSHSHYSRLSHLNQFWPPRGLRPGIDNAPDIVLTILSLDTISHNEELTANHEWRRLTRFIAY